MSEWFQIESDSLIVQVNSKGAEVKRLFSKKWNKELLWSGDERVWGRSAPILFPIVGKLKDDEYQLKEKVIKLHQHGFARDCDFFCHKRSSSEIEFVLMATQETFALYPFCFELRVRYQVIDEKLLVTYEVYNDDRQDMYFSIGAHPAFDTKNLSDFAIRFEKNEDVYYRLEKGLVNWKAPYDFEKNVLELNSELFSADALIFEKLNSSYVDLFNLKTDQVIRLNFSSPYLGIWGKGSVPFVCLEPWHGVSDSLEHDKNFETKKGIVTLPMKEVFTFSYSIEIWEHVT